MADISHLHPLMQEALRTGRVPGREDLARLLGKKIEDIPDPDAETPPEEVDSAEPEDPAAEAFHTRYHAMVAERVAAWLVDEEDRDINALTDYRGSSVPPGVRERIEHDCHREIQQQWRTFLQRRDHPDDDDDDGLDTLMQTVR